MIQYDADDQIGHDMNILPSHHRHSRSIIQSQLVLFTDCVMNSTMKKTTESVMSIKTKELKNCTKTMAVELQTQTV